MWQMIFESKRNAKSIHRKDFVELGKSLEFYDGVSEWFDRINDYGKKLGLHIEHYIISSGFEEMISGTSIRKHFKDVFGCSYVYGDDDTPIWPARVVNYSGKTQFIAKINKGLGKTEDRAVNEYMPDELRPIPYKQMIYFGDGMTDIPCMKIVKNNGGTSIAVYRPKSNQRHNAIQLLTDNRVNFALPADYREDSELDHVVKTILNRMATERDLDILKVKENHKKKEVSSSRMKLSERLSLLAKKMTKK